MNNFRSYLAFSVENTAHINHFQSALKWIMNLILIKMLIYNQLTLTENNKNKFPR